MRAPVVSGDPTYVAFVTHGSAFEREGLQADAEGNIAPERSLVVGFRWVKDQGVRITIDEHLWREEKAAFLGGVKTYFTAEAALQLLGWLFYHRRILERIARREEAESKR